MHHARSAVRSSVYQFLFFLLLGLFILPSCLSVKAVVLDKENGIEDYRNYGQNELYNVERFSPEKTLAQAGSVDPHLGETQ